MSRFKELREKQAAGTITEEEKTELQDFQKDVDEAADEDNGSGSDDEAVEEATDKLAKSIQSSMEQSFAKLTADLKVKETPKEKVESEAKFIIDPAKGKISVKELEDEKVVLSDRKAAGKKNFEVSMKTVHFLQALVNSDKEKLQVLVEGTGSRGGYLVPEDFVNIVVEDRRDLTVMRQLATVLPVSTDTIHVPNLASRPHAFWRAEGAVKSTTTVDFGETVLTPYSLAAIVVLSNELIADARLGGNIVNLVAQYMARSLAEEEDKAFWTGNGSGKPTGIDNYSFSTIDAGAGASDSVRADSIIKSIFRLPQGYRSNAAFVANRNTWAKVATLKDSQNNYLLSDLGSAASPTLRGLRTYEQNDLGDGKMFVGDFSYYYIADREGIQVDISRDAVVASQSLFERNLTGIRVEERVDGELTLTQPIVELNNLGGN